HSRHGARTERRPPVRRGGERSPRGGRLRPGERAGGGGGLPPGRPGAGQPLGLTSPPRRPLVVSMFKAEPFVTRLTFVASDRPEAQEAQARLATRYGDAGRGNAQVVVALGGDGFMLETLHEHMADGAPIYGMNRGSVGFLMNEYSEDDLLERINAAERAVVHPLRMRASDEAGRSHDALA